VSHRSLFVSFAVTSLLNYVFSLAASRLLTSGDFGLLGVAQAIVLVASLILFTGVPWSLARSIAVEEPIRRHPLIRGAVVANVALAGIIGGVIVVLFAAGPFRAAFESWAIVAAVAGTLPFFAIVAIARAAAQGYARFSRLAGLQLAEVTSKVVAGLLLAALGFGAIGATLGFFVGALVGACLGIATLVVTFGVRPIGPVAMVSPRSAGAMFGALLGLALLLNEDLLAVKLFGGNRALAGYYQAALMLANVPYFLVSSTLVPVLFTRVSRHSTISETWASVADVLRVAVVFVIPFEIVLAIRPVEVLAFFLPAKYAASAPLLQVMAIGNAAVIVTVILSAAFQAIGRAAVPAMILLVTCLVEGVTLAIVVPDLQAAGAVIVFATAAVASLIVTAGAYIREANVHIDARAAAWILRLAAASIMGVAVGNAVGGAILSIVVAGLVYFSLVFALGIVAPRLTPLLERT
jgi:O-antigen/teichoic acid export membrane protein